MQQSFDDILSGPVGTIVHIGAGQGADVPRWHAAAPARIVLVEPDPAQQGALVQAAEAAANARVVAAALTPDTTPRPLNCFEFSALNALRAPTGLRDIFPNLGTPTLEKVDLRDPADFIEGLGLEPEQTHVLIVEAPGEEMAIIEALRTRGLLDKFAGLRVQAGAEPFYEGAADMTAIIAFLEKAGFGIDEADAQDDPDFPTVEAVRAQGADASGDIAKLKAEVKTLRRQVGTLKGTVTRRDKTVETQAATQEAAEKTLKEVREKLTAASRGRDEARAKLEEQGKALEEAREKLTAASKGRDEALAKLKNLSNGYDSLSAKHDQTAKALKEIRTRTESIESDAKAHAATLSEVRGKLTAASRGRDEARAKLEEQGKTRAALEERLAQSEKRATQVDHCLQELSRAEGQIGLLRELLLRGDAL